MIRSMDDNGICKTCPNPKNIPKTPCKNCAVTGHFFNYMDMLVDCWWERDQEIDFLLSEIMEKYEMKGDPLYE